MTWIRGWRIEVAFVPLFVVLVLVCSYLKTQTNWLSSYASRVMGMRRSSELICFDGCL